MKKKVIAFVGGGTGGHIYPGLNVMQYVQKKEPETNVFWIGEKGSLEQGVMAEHGIQFSGIVCGKLRRYLAWQTLLVPFQVIIGTFQSLSLLLKYRVTHVFSKGGYVSFPVCVAARMLRKKVILHESDSVAGLANRLCGTFATDVFVGFDEARQYFADSKVRGVGPLLHESIIRMHPKKADKKKKGPIKVFVSCGSQGSSVIFDALYDIAPTLDGFEFHVVLGTRNVSYRDKLEEQGSFVCYDFFTDQKKYLQLAKTMDLVVTRSGSSIFEFAAIDLSMIMVPHPHTGNNHQYWNAKAFEKFGHVLIEQDDLAMHLPTVLADWKDNPMIISEPEGGDFDIYQKILKILE